MAEMFSTKGRYALRTMADIGSHEGWVSLGDIAERQGLSRKYLEQIIALMSKAKLVTSQRGKHGGYRLARPAHEYTLGEILRAAEGNLAPVSCLDCSTGVLCPKIESCTTVDIWRDLGKVTSAFLDSKTLADLIGPDGAGVCPL